MVVLIGHKGLSDLILCDYGPNMHLHKASHIALREDTAIPKTTK